MEGFDPEKYTELLNLSNQNLKPVVILPIGFRSEKETMADLPKVRKSRTELVVEI